MNYQQSLQETVKQANKLKFEIDSYINELHLGRDIDQGLLETKMSEFSGLLSQAETSFEEVKHQWDEDKILYQQKKLERLQEAE